VPGNHLMKVRIAVVNQQLRIFSSAINATGDGGRSWRHSAIRASRVHAVDARGALASLDGKVKLGHLQAGGPTWAATGAANLGAHGWVAVEAKHRLLGVG
jgi:hypothetical protein